MSIFDSSPLNNNGQKVPSKGACRQCGAGKRAKGLEICHTCANGAIKAIYAHESPSNAAARAEFNADPVEWEARAEETAAMLDMLAPICRLIVWRLRPMVNHGAVSAAVAAQTPLMAYCPKCGELADFSDALMPEWAMYQCPECFMDFLVSELAPLDAPQK